MFNYSIEEDGVASYLSLLLSLLKLVNSLLLLIGPEIKELKEEEKKFITYYETIVSLSSFHLSFFPSSSILVGSFNKERLKFVQLLSMFHFDSLLTNGFDAIKQFIIEALNREEMIESIIASVASIKEEEAKRKKEEEETNSFHFELSLIHAAEFQIRKGSVKESKKEGKKERKKERIIL